jgi:hypothetical protein
VELQLVVPHLPQKILRLEVIRWLKEPGDDVAFGDQVCELEVREYVSVNRSANEGKGSKSAKPGAGILVMVTASDRGRMVEVEAKPGDLVVVGSPLARIAAEQHEPSTAATPSAPTGTEAGPSALPPFHAVADVVGSRAVKHKLSAKQRAARLYRKVFGSRTTLERTLRARNAKPAAAPRREQAHTAQHTVRREGENLIITAVDDPAPRRGIHLCGGCDLPALLEPGEDVVAEVHGTLAIGRSPLRISAARSDILLQTLEDLPSAAVREITDALQLPSIYFDPNAFVKTFTVPGHDDIPDEEFPIAVTVLSVGADVVRPAYRHKKTGILVDPGGFWLDGETLSNAQQQSFRKYLMANFEKATKLTAAQHAENFRRLVPALREHTGGDVMTFNVLTIEPHDRTHNYQLRKVPEGARRRQFHLAQAELSAELDYHVVDVDRALKRVKVAGQIDFAHFPSEQYPTVATEAFGALRNAGQL